MYTALASTSQARDTTATAEADSSRPTKIGRYLVLHLLGKGAMGEVYAAYDPELERKIAIKLLRGKPGNDAEAAEGRLRMMREAQAIAKLSHPNVVVVYDVGAFHDQVFVAMEFVEGHTGWYWMNSQTRPWAEVLKIFGAAGRGLAAAHEKGLVHRDFKPENVMVGIDGQVRVMDFGLARSVGPTATSPSPAAAPPPAARINRERLFATAANNLDDGDIESTRAIGGSTTRVPFPTSSGAEGHVTITQAGAIMGTPAYMSPEQFRGQDTDARTDQFSFCVSLYEALYGERPFAGTTPHALEDSVLRGDVRPPPAHVDVPSWIRTVLLRGLSRHADDRWPSMKALLGELERSLLSADRMRFVDSAAARLSQIWPVPTPERPTESAAKLQMREAFRATGKSYAALTFERVSAALDRYAQSWAEMYIDICEATHVRGDQSAEVMDLRMGCLMDLLAGLRALCVIFRDANGDVVERAVDAVNALGDIGRCADIQLLRTVVKPPEDQATRTKVDQLRSRLAEVRVLCQVGRIVEGLAAIDPIEREARATGYLPLLAETLAEQAKLYGEQRNAELGAKVYEEALWAAELCRHDEVAVLAATSLVFLVGDTQLRFDIAEIWARHAETILKRLGGHDIIWGWLFNNRGSVREKQGRLAESLEDARRAMAFKERALGPDNPDVALSLNNIALTLAQTDQEEEALSHFERALGIMVQSLGPEHPRTVLVRSNYGEILNKVSRFAEARVHCAHAASVFERELPGDDYMLSYPLTALGVACLGAEEPNDALPVLERAAAIRDAKETNLASLGEVHFALARTLFALGQDLPRARTLAERSRDEYARAPQGPVPTRELARITNWLTAHARSLP